MFPMNLIRKVLVLSCLALLTLLPAAASAQTSGIILWALTSDNTLVRFDAFAPGTVLASVPVTGLGDGEVIQGIDFRPANGRLVAVTSANRLLVIDTASGAAAPISGAIFTTALNGTNFGFDFNPTVDRIRLTSDVGQDLRLNPLNGALAFVDGTLTYAGTDANAGATPQIVASAYTNNFLNSTATTLYDLDAGLDLLVIQNPPNNGVLVTVGPVGVNVDAAASFDIFSDGNGTDTAFASLNGTLYTINLATGAASPIGAIAMGGVRAIAVTGSRSPVAGVPLCGDFDGSVNPIVRGSFPGAAGNVYCKVLAENGNFTFALASAQIGDAGIIARGVLQAADVFVQGNGSSPVFSASGQVCLSGEGVFFYLDATTSPRRVTIQESTFVDGYTCAFIPNAGTVILTRS